MTREEFERAWRGTTPPPPIDPLGGGCHSLIRLRHQAGPRTRAARLRVAIDGWRIGELRTGEEICRQVESGSHSIRVSTFFHRRTLVVDVNPGAHVELACGIGPDPRSRWRKLVPAWLAILGLWLSPGL